MGSGDPLLLVVSGRFILSQAISCNESGGGGVLFVA